MTERRRAVFLGSGAFAVPVLDALAAAPACALVAVVSAPPRPSGRASVPTRTPVHARADELGVLTLTPERLRDPETLRALERLAPDALVLADYGQLVPPEILALPGRGALNLHPSLLPRHRGASPIPAAILSGDAETGVSLMLMDAGLDTGPVMARVRLALDGTETTPTLETRLAALAAELLTASLEPWLDDHLPAVPQPDGGVTTTRPLHREDGRANPALGVIRLERMVRAYQPWPGTFFEVEAGRIVIWAAAVGSMMTESGARPGMVGQGPDHVALSGRLVAEGDGLALEVADGRLCLLEVQAAGGRRMSSAELRRGRPGLVGSRLVDPSLR